jgi:5,10-methylenetetrahydromethanopterin reductase
MGEFPNFGTRLHGGIDPRHCVELAKVAEANGFTSVWFAENPFNRGVLPAASASAAATHSIRIGIGVFNPYNRHPTLIAMEIGALDDLSEGRAGLGIGSGIGAAIGRMGLSYEHPLAAVRDAIIIVRALLGGEEIDYGGRIFSTRKVKLDYKPRRAALPLFMAARGDQALRLCGELADGLMISNCCPVDFTVHAVAAVRATRREATRNQPFEVLQYVPCAARPNRDEAREMVRNAIGEMLPDFWSLGERFPAARAALLRDRTITDSDFAHAMVRLRAGESARSVLDDRFLDAFGLAGTAEDCLAQASAYAKAGVTEVVLTFVDPRPEESMHHLGRAMREHRKSEPQVSARS